MQLQLLMIQYQSYQGPFFTEVNCVKDAYEYVYKAISRLICIVITLVDYHVYCVAVLYSHIMVLIIRF